MTDPAPLLLHVFPTFAVGGAQARFAALANFQGPRFRHMILALDGCTDARVRLSPDLDVTYPAPCGGKNAFLSSILTYRRLLAEWRPACMLTYNWGAIEFAFANLLPVVPHIHVIDGFGSDEYFVRLRRRIIANRMALANSTTVVPSVTLRTILTEEWSLPTEQVRYIPNGIDLARFSSPGRVVEPGKPMVIGTVAALRPEKNIARLLLAFARLDPGLPARLVIGGDGACRDELHGLASSLGIRDRVEFTGHRDDVHAQLARFDIFALSSDTEQMPIVVLEAMASGIPVVSTDVGDIRIMVSDANAALIGDGSPEGLAQVMARLVQDPAERATLGAANRAMAEARFNQDRMFAAWDELLTGQIL
jgi:glycosyltransferase involved in cell wall biosynthesis